MNPQDFITRQKEQQYKKAIRRVVLWFPIIIFILIGATTYYIEKTTLSNVRDQIEKISSSTNNRSAQVSDQSSQNETKDKNKNKEKEDLIFDTQYSNKGKDISTKIIFKYKGKNVGEILENGYYVPEIFKKTNKNIYISLAQGGSGDALNLYGNPRILYRFSLSKLTIAKVNINNGQIGDISSDEKKIAYVLYPADNSKNSLKFIIQNIESSKIEYEKILPNKYRAAGDIFFSPDNRKVVYVAAKWNPPYVKENVTVYILNLAKKEEQIFLNINDGYCIVQGWKDPENLMYKVYGTYPKGEPKG